jgi:hypothetical protein
MARTRTPKPSKPTKSTPPKPRKTKQELAAARREKQVRAPTQASHRLRRHLAKPGGCYNEIVLADKAAGRRKRMISQEMVQAKEGARVREDSGDDEVVPRFEVNFLSEDIAEMVFNAGLSVRLG